MRRSLTLAIPAMLAVLLGVTACGGNAPPQTLPTPDGSATIDTGAPTPDPSVVTVTVTQGGGGGGGGGGGSWPSPEDCISYNPNNVTYEDFDGSGFTWNIKAGSTKLVTVYGDESTAQHAANVAKRYKKVCFIGRGNSREFKEDYIFEYWRDGSGINSPLPDSDEACHNYDRNNLTVDSMGERGWRVRDHDDVLHIFDTQLDAQNGKIVLSKYGHICSVESQTDNTEDGVRISYTR